MYINFNKLSNTGNATPNNEQSNLVHKNGKLNLTNINATVKESIGLGNVINLRKNISNTSQIEDSSHLPSPEVIARKIATGKEVSQEELEYLKSVNYQLYLSAIQAERYLEKTKQKIASASSETAKMRAVSEAINMAISFSANSEGSSHNELIGLAIMEAVKDESQNIQKETKNLLNFSETDLFASDTNDAEKKISNK